MRDYLPSITTYPTTDPYSLRLLFSFSIDTSFIFFLYIFKFKLVNKCIAIMATTTPLKLLYQICSYTNCYPPYNFKILSLKTGSKHILYVFLAMSLVVAQFIFSTYARCAILKMEFSMLIADTFANISLCGCNIINCMLCYYIGNKYMNKLILLHARVDFNTNQNQERERSAETSETNASAKQVTAQNNYYCKDFIIIIFCHCIFIAMIALDIYVTLFKFNKNAIFYYFFKYVQYYCVTSQILYTIFAMKQIKKLITFIMKTLFDQMNSFLVLPVAEMRESNQGLFTVTGWTKTALNTKANVKDVDNVIVASHKYKDIYLLCYYYNLIFGWPLLFVMGAVLFELIETMNFLVQYPQNHAANNVWMLCLKIFTAGYFYVSNS